MYAFSNSAGKWLKLGAEQRSSRVAPSRLRVLTYNVWFDAFEQARRAQALLTILQEELPDIIALQEVTPPFLAMLLAEPFVRGHYASSRIKLMSTERYDVVMLSRLPVRSFTAHRLTSEMGRSLHALRIATTGGSLLVASVHLESMKERTPTRLVQIAESIPILCAADFTIWLGDFNAAPSSIEEEHILPVFRDAWSELSDQPGYTRDTTQNAMLAKLKNDRHQRIDRVFLRGALFEPKEVRMLGTCALAGSNGEIFPSDHFGLVADFAANNEAKRIAGE